MVVALPKLNSGQNDQLLTVFIQLFDPRSS